MNFKHSFLLKKVHNANLEQSRYIYIYIYTLHYLNMNSVLLLENPIRSKQKMKEGTYNLRKH